MRTQKSPLGEQVHTLATFGPRHHFDFLTIRRVGNNVPKHVFRTEDGYGEDIIKASARPFYVLVARRQPDGSVKIKKLSWHNTEERAREHFNTVVRRTRPGGAAAVAVALVSAEEVR